MKALLLRISPNTNTLPSRYIVTVQGQKRFIISCESEQFDYTSDAPILLNQVAKLAINHFGFSHLDHTVGQLPNGDNVITLCEPVTLYKAEFNCNFKMINSYYLGTQLDVKKRVTRDEIAVKAYSVQLNAVKNYVGDTLFYKVEKS